MSGENDEVPVNETEKQMFFMRKSILTVFMWFIGAIILFVCAIVGHSVYKDKQAPSIDSFIAILELITRMFEKLAG